MASNIDLNHSIDHCWICETKNTNSTNLTDLKSHHHKLCPLRGSNYKIYEMSTCVYPFKCKVIGCLEQHQNHICQYCMNFDSDHFPIKCTKLTKDEKEKIIKETLSKY